MQVPEDEWVKFLIIVFFFLLPIGMKSHQTELEEIGQINMTDLKSYYNDSLNHKDFTKKIWENVSVVSGQKHLLAWIQTATFE